MRVLALLLIAGCTTLGPMGATTGISALQTGRPGVEVQIAATPGYYLSSAVTEEHKGAPIPSLSVLFEPDRWIHLPGLYVSGRIIGDDDSGVVLEPVIGYRRTIDRMSLGIAFFGTQGSHAEGEASYRSLRVGSEVHGDVRINRPGNFELHVVAGAMGTYLSAEGDYCSTTTGFGRDCNGDPADTSAEASGFYPSAHLGLALVAAHRMSSFFHGARVTLSGAAGSMPTVVNGVQEKGAFYGSVGLSFTVGLGTAD